MSTKTPQERAERRATNQSTVAFLALVSFALFALHLAGRL